MGRVYGISELPTLPYVVTASEDMIVNIWSNSLPLQGLVSTIPSSSAEHSVLMRAILIVIQPSTGDTGSNPEPLLWISDVTGKISGWQMRGPKVSSFYDTLFCLKL